MKPYLATHAIQLGQLLRDNPSLTMAHYDIPADPRLLHIYFREDIQLRALRVPRNLQSLIITPHPGPAFHDLRAPLARATALNENQQCQNEPIKLGTQCQPKGANWLGTAGCPAKWRDSAGVLHWGYLTNWHVLSSGQFDLGTTCHQPDDSKPAFGRLAAMSPVLRDKDNLVDAALADTYVNGKHTTCDQILAIGKYSHRPIVAEPGLAVMKSGRTTGYTEAKCSAVGAAVKVGYGDFDATFIDQDVYKHTEKPFSAAGDSGSLILGSRCSCACSLLFAGGGDMTIGNPMRHVIDALGLIFPFL